MQGLEVSLDPSDLEADAVALQLVSSGRASHVLVAQSMWNDLYSEIDDPKLLGFGKKSAGQSGAPSTAWRAFTAEWRELSCTDNAKYDGLRDQVKALRGRPATVIVSTIAAGLSNDIGIEAGLLVPFVAILLHGILTVGNNVICRTLAKSGRDD